MDTAHDVDHLRDAEIPGDAEQRIGIQLGHVRTRRKELDRVARQRSSPS